MSQLISIQSILVIGVSIAVFDFGSFAAAQSTTNDAAEKSIVLFDGSSLDQFRGYANEKIPASWKIEGDSLAFDGSGGGDIMTKAQFENFELSFEWKIEPGANSGVIYRVTTGDSAPYISGPEYQILDDAQHGDGSSQLTSAASLYGMYAPEGKNVRPAGQWNSGKIVHNGNHVSHWLNGKKVVQAEIDSDDWNRRRNDSKFKDWEKFAASKKGHICFQDHGNKVWYRNIKVKAMP